MPYLSEALAFCASVPDILEHSDSGDANGDVDGGQTFPARDSTSPRRQTHIDSSRRKWRMIEYIAAVHNMHFLNRSDKYLTNCVMSKGENGMALLKPMQ